MLLRIRSTCRIRLLLRLRVARRAAMCRTVACWYSRSDAPDGDARLQALSNIRERYRSPTQTRPSQLVEYDRRPAPPVAGRLSLSALSLVARRVSSKLKRSTAGQGILFYPQACPCTFQTVIRPTEKSDSRR